MVQVSAIITTHNRCELLKKAIESVLNQTYKGIECIVVDDNSMDNTQIVCSHYPVRYIYISKEDSHGGNYARNVGIKTAKGEYVAFLDDDDVWLPNKIEKQLALLQEKKCDCVYCLRLMEHIKDGIVLSQKKEGIAYKYEGDLSKKIFRHSITSTSCILATKKILDQIGGFDEALPKMQEFELLVRISQLSNIYYCHDEALVRYTLNLSDKNRISNDPSRLPVAKRMIEEKHALLLKKAGLINRFCFEDRMFIAFYKQQRKSQKSVFFNRYSLYYYATLLFRQFYEYINEK